MNAIRIVLPTLLVGLLTVACQSAAPTPYQPLDRDYGYSETLAGDGRYEVRFQGNEATPLPVIENYLLYRAAELAKQQNRTRFAVIAPENATIEIVQTGDRTVCQYSPANFSQFVYYSHEPDLEEVAGPGSNGVS